VVFAKRPQTEFDNPATVARGYEQQLSYNSGSQRLEWYYSLPGDYDQDGRVFLDDLIVFDIHIETAGPFSPGMVQSLIDSNDDGYISTDDVTDLGRHLNQTQTGYNIYATANPAEVPSEPDAPSTIQPVGFVPFEAAMGDTEIDRLRFSEELSVPAGSNIWIRPVYSGSEGTASDIVTAE
jgi:hypothetical protein